ncbi:MAG: radical SAM family heme chaperone HemW [Gammaproteobacteria bacterium]|nr:radical SAM family heme chaperone HemW [Gammaproteobacteria bacterium]
MTIPLSLYIHLPWCIKKCPYCDFNSHALTTTLPEDAYIDRLINDFISHIETIGHREISSVFFGGGTPSLFSARSLDKLLKTFRSLIKFSENCEITLEANPGTVEQQRFKDYFIIGINRLSLGIQSFQGDKLKILGRIHDGADAHNSIETVKKAGFTNFNIDIMHGLPTQSITDALHDLQHAVNYRPTHLSWYQLTIEPNTYFYRHTPILPDEKILEEIEAQGLHLLNTHQYERYEISAYSLDGKQSIHNKNYWLYGDYLGIGAGAHSKLTIDDKIIRHWNHKSPHSYLDQKRNFISNQLRPQEKDTVFEFMLNALRLYQPVSFDLFEERTQLSRTILFTPMSSAIQQGLLKDQENIETTALGKQYLNDLCRLFL